MDPLEQTKANHILHTRETIPRQRSDPEGYVSFDSGELH